MRSFFSFIAGIGIFTLAFCPAVHADNIIQTKAVEITLQNLGVRAPFVFSEAPKEIRYTHDEWETNLVRLITEEHLVGTVASDYLSYLAEDPDFSRSARREVLKLLPQLELDEGQFETAHRQLMLIVPKPVFNTDSEKQVREEGFNLGKIFADARNTY
jgi:hypothetical protein